MPVVVLPDIQLPRGLVEDVTNSVGAVLFRHPSGSPWIMGTGDGRRILSARNEDTEVVVIGSDTMDLDERDLSRLIRGKRSVVEFDSVAARLAEGDVLFLARERARLRSQAPLFLMKSLCWATVHDVCLISDEQMTLKLIAGLRPDPAVLASRLTDVELAYPFGLKSIWRGVDTAGPGEWLDSRGGHAPARVVWWRPPEPDKSVREVSDQLREDISAALQRRTGPHREISADLSGGLDSTTLTYFLAGLGRKPRTLFLSSTNVANNDHKWADRAASELGTEHRTAPYSSVIPFLLDARTGSVGSFPEGPSIASVAVASVSLIESMMQGAETTLHLNGHGGDALFGPVSTMLWSLVHSREEGRFRRAWHHRVVNRFPVGKTLRMVARRQSYTDDLRRIARDDFRRRDDEVTSQSRWMPLPNVHPALTDAARDYLRHLAAEAVRQDHSHLSANRTTHQILQYLIVHGNVVRRMNQASSPSAGIYFDSPYLDRSVVETSLSLKIGDRVRQYPAKPLLAAARPPEMSLDYFKRRDKGDYTAEVFQQHQALHPLLKELFSGGSVLEDIGLVSAERVMRSVNEFSTDGSTYTDLVYIAFAERWLRSVT